MNPAAARALQLADDAFQKASPNSIALLEKAVLLCERAGCTANVECARALRQLGHELGLTGQYTRALHLTDNALAILSARNEKDEEVLEELAKCSSLRGNAFGVLGRHADALLAQKDALRRYELLGTDMAGMIGALINIGTLLAEMEQNGEALRHMRLAEARALAKPGGDVEFARQLAAVALTIGGLLGSLERWDEALVSLRLSQTRMRTCAGSPDFTIANVANLNIKIGHALYKLGDYAGAMAHFSAAESILKQRGWKDVVGSDLHSSMGEMAMEQGRHQDALDRFHRCLAIQRAFYPPDHPLLARTHFFVCMAQAALGKSSEAVASLQVSTWVTRRSQTRCAGPKCERKLREDGAPLDQCAGCLRTYYCSVACQTADWKGGQRRSARRWQRR